MSNTQQEVNTMTPQERLDAYNLIVGGCHHIWSKNKLQEDKAQEVLNQLIPLTQKDPFFLAHLTSWAMKNSKAKDLRVFLAYVASLSDADGSPFSPGSEYKKPALRYIGWASLLMLEPKLVERIFQVSNRKYEVADYFNLATHRPGGLVNAGRKYLRYREENLPMLEGIVKAKLGNVVKQMYRRLRISPSKEAATVLRWAQKDGSVEITDAESIFEDLDDLEIAELVRKEKLGRIAILSELSKVNRKISPVIAVAMLENSTPDQVVIMRATLEDSGILKDPEAMKLFKSKIADAKTTLDRVDNIAKTASEEIKTILKKAKSTERKSELDGIGKVFLHLDISSSMDNSIELAKKYGAIIAEMVPNPEKNFQWAAFNSDAQDLKMPDKFTEDAFSSALYGVRCWGMTDSLANYAKARAFGADVDVFISDGGHNGGDIKSRINKFHRDNPNIKKPKAMVWVPSGEGRWGNGDMIFDGYTNAEIPSTRLMPNAITESALVAQAVKVAMSGPVAIIDDIMSTELLTLPEYFYSIDKKEK